MTKEFDAKDPSTWAVTFNRELSQDEINFYAPQMQASYDGHVIKNQRRAELGLEPLPWKDVQAIVTTDNVPNSPFVIGGTSAQ